MKYIVTVDIGTTSVKTGLFNETLNAVGFVSNEYELITPRKGFVELNPEVYWDTVTRSIQHILRVHGVKGPDVASIAICSQGETLIPVAANGDPLHQAIVWIDARAEEEAKYLKEVIGDDRYYRVTGLNEIWAANPICKLLWFKRNLPDVYDKTDKFLLLTDFIAFRLTGRIMSEWTMMSSTGYYDINRHEVWKEGLQLAGLDSGKIPEVSRSGVVVGTVQKELADTIAVSSNTKVIISANDQMCGAVGGGNFEPGVVTETTGTALVIAATVEKPDYDLPQRFVYYLHVNGRYLIVPYATTAGIVLKWFKDEFCHQEIVESRETGVGVYELLDRMVEQVVPLADGLMLYPHFAGKVSPTNNPNAKGCFINVGLESKRGHFVRSIFESIAYMLKENILAIESSGVRVAEVRSLGGGSRSDAWSQIKSDVLSKPVLTLVCEEATSVGVAVIAALNLGWYPDLGAACERVVKINRSYLPDSEVAKKYQKGYEFYNKLDKALATLFEDPFYI